MGKDFAEQAGGIWITPEHLKAIFEVLVDYPKHDVYITRVQGNASFYYVKVASKEMKDYSKVVPCEFVVGKDLKAHILIKRDPKDG